MDHADHVALLRPAIAATRSSSGAVWADIGAGDGAFTLALADLLGPDAQIVAVDRDGGPLRSNAASVARQFPATKLRTLVGDFTRPLDLPPLDGIVAANSIHFVPRADQAGIVRAVAASLKPGAMFVVVEYDADSGNRWVPYPFSAGAWSRLAEAAGLVEPRTLHRVPSRFLGAIYSACAQRSPD